MTTSTGGTAAPVVRPVHAADIADALVHGFRDFRAAPAYGLAIGAFYATGGLVIVLCITAFGLSYLAYPMAAGFALIGPFAAVALYEVSRRLETRSPISFREIFRVICSRSEIGWMGFVTLFVFVIWMYQVRLLIALIFGVNLSFSTLQGFLAAVLTTNEGLLFLLIGNLDGGILSILLFSLTVVSFPLLLERDVDFVTAMITSVQAVLKSPLPMLGWAAIIVMLLFVSILPTFLGLVFTLPILGHASWHLYRRIVAPIGQEAVPKMP